MTFDYLQSNLSKSFGEDIKGRFNDAFMAEIQERARLLCHLGVSLDEAVERINKNVEWEFDETWTTGLPPVHAQTRELVTAVYAKLSR
mgnify:CR=1 FL=1